MSLQQLIAEVSDHYRLRSFHKPAINHLENQIKKSVVGPYLDFAGRFNFSKRIDKLLNKFPIWSPGSQVSSSQEAKAIFGFSFGYREKTRQAPGEEKRLPGRNNRELAVIAADEKRQSRLPLYVQFEISDALDDYTDVLADFAAPTEDMGTRKAIEYFLDHAKKQGQKFDKVIVVAHQHQMQRCMVLLSEDFRLDGIPASKSYADYDPEEKQWRVLCEEMYIVSDFISMAARVKN